MDQLDLYLENADWSKQSWDLPPYKSQEFLDAFPDLRAFRKLPVYDAAVKAGIIVDDEWVGLKKRAKINRGKAIPPVYYDRPLTREYERRVHKSIAMVLRATGLAAGKTAQRLAIAAKLGKASKTQDDVVMSIDLSKLKGIPPKVRSAMQDVFKDAGYASLRNVRLTVPEITLPEQAFKQIDEFSADWAEHRSAEMVGMKYVDGELVTNPDAHWAIDEETREGIRAAVQEVAEGKAPVTELASTIKDSYAFSNARAEMIARTEMRFANGQGALAGLRTSGAVEFKVWLTAEDDDVSDDCQANSDQGPIPIDDSFESGDDCEPAHPNCRCSVNGYVSFDDTEGVEE